jgi:hypothetical protein
MKTKARWKAHECSVCGRWRSQGVMLSAGVGRHRHFKFVCSVCRMESVNESRVERALQVWEIEKGYSANGS